MCISFTHTHLLACSHAHSPPPPPRLPTLSHWLPFILFSPALALVLYFFFVVVDVCCLFNVFFFFLSSCFCFSHLLRASLLHRQHIHSYVCPPRTPSLPQSLTKTSIHHFRLLSACVCVDFMLLFSLRFLLVCVCLFLRFFLVFFVAVFKARHLAHTSKCSMSLAPSHCLSLERAFCVSFCVCLGIFCLIFK